jgi:hypothetical protein
MPLPFEISLVGTGGGSCLLMEPHGVSSRPAVHSLQGEAVATPSAAGFLDKDGALGATRFEFQYVTESRAETAFLREYFDARRGRWGGFWFPTWTRELDLADYHAAVTDAVWIVSQGYADKVYPLGPAYRRVVFALGDNYEHGRIHNVALNDPAPGMERLDLDQTGGTGFGSLGSVPWTERTGVVLLSLRYGRFDTDALSIEPTGDGCANITLPIVEVPDEATE